MEADLIMPCVIMPRASNVGLGICVVWQLQFAIPTQPGDPGIEDLHGKTQEKVRRS